jgi:hypothetical protein|tara:strand:- start:153 stop:377 length:225 start_codon:yes stop_codon:yes gene_type:complete
MHAFVASFDGAVDALRLHLEARSCARQDGASGKGGAGQPSVTPLSESASELISDFAQPAAMNAALFVLFTATHA